MPRPLPLISLHLVTVEVGAGARGLGLCRYRQLDALSLVVHRGELILLRGGLQHGTTTLLRVLAGDERIRPHMKGDRQTLMPMAIHTGCIPVEAIAPVVSAWQAPLRHVPWRTPRQISSTACVYLLRALEGLPAASADAATWSRWSCQLFRRQGTLVIAEERSSISTPGSLAHDAMNPLEPDAPAQNAMESLPYRRNAWDAVRQVRENSGCTCENAQVRVLQLGFGRIRHERVHAPATCAACRGGTASK